MSVRQPSRDEVPLVKPAGGVPAAAPEAEGALVVALRWPVRIVVLVLVVPARMAWDALVVCGRALRRTVWEPFVTGLAWLGRALFVWPWVGLWRYVLVPVGRGLCGAGVWWYRRVLTPLGHGVAVAVRGVGVALAWLGRMMVVLPAAWMYRWLLVPLGGAVAAAWVWLYRWLLTPGGRAVAAVVRALGAALVWLAKALFVWPWVGLWRYVLVPVGRGLGWLGHVVIVIPAAALYRYVLTPVGRVLAVLGREIADAVVVCGQLAGRISRAVFGFLGRGLRLLLVDPAVWVWRHVLAPVGRWLRDHVWRPVADGARGVGRTVRGTVASARATAREVWADVRRALFRGPRRAAPEPGAAPAPRPATPPGEASASRSEPVPLRKSAGR